MFKLRQCLFVACIILGVSLFVDADDALHCGQTECSGLSTHCCSYDVTRCCMSDVMFRDEIGDLVSDVSKLFWWVWLLIALGILAVIGCIVGCVVCCCCRKQPQVIVQSPMTAYPAAYPAAAPYPSNAPQAPVYPPHYNNAAYMRTADVNETVQTIDGAPTPANNIYPSTNASTNF